jgi:hypothetical protein
LIHLRVLDSISKPNCAAKRKARSKRKGSPWTDFVKKVHTEMKRKDKNASLGDAMKEASKRKKEMKH